MTALALAGAVELLDRSLAWVRPALAGVRPEHLALPTPCHGWPLGVLLAHVDDGLDAWTEAATGRVALTPTPGVTPVTSIRDKACALLGWWLDHPPGVVDVGDRVLPSETLVAAAALEITLHGWDLHATLAPADVPADLAAPLHAVARLVLPPERSGCFGAPVVPVPGASASQRLVAFLGRG